MTRSRSGARKAAKGKAVAVRGSVRERKSLADGNRRAAGSASNSTTGSVSDSGGSFPLETASGDDPHSIACTCAVLRRASRRVTQAYDQALKPLGLRLTQYSLLANVLRSGGLTITDLAERLAMERTTLTRNLKPLEAAGWLWVKPGPDRRSRAVEITDEGRRVIDLAVPAWQQAERELRKSMGEEKAAQLRQLLSVAMESVD